MASFGGVRDQISSAASQVEIPVYNINQNQREQKQCRGGREDEKEEMDYSQRAQWLRAAVLGANDGLVSVSSLMMGIGAVKEDVKAMLLAGFAGLVAGACSMAIGEFVSVYTQYDVERAQMKRDMVKYKSGDDDENRGNRRKQGSGHEEKEEEESIEKEKLPNPAQAAIASAMAFTVGALVPLVAAGFIKEHKVRLGVVAAVASLALVVFGGVGAVLGRTPVVKSCARVLVGGWLAMAVTFGLTKLIGTRGMDV